jgi:hypothetical protein
MNLLKKIAFGAYILTMKQGQGRWSSFISAKMMLGFVPAFFFLVIIFFIGLLFDFFIEFPYWSIYLIPVIVIVIVPLKKIELDDMFDNTDEAFQRIATRTFWIGTFGPIVFLLLVLFFLKFIGEL